MATPAKLNNAQWRRVFRESQRRAVLLTIAFYVAGLFVGAGAMLIWKGL